MIKPEAIEFFQNSGVFGAEEVEARYHVSLERYIKDLEIEVEAMSDMVGTLVLPAAYQQQELLARSLWSMGKVLGDQYMKDQSKTLLDCAESITKLQTALTELKFKVKTAEEIEDGGAKASFFAGEIMNAMSEIREVCDHLEENVADQFWPLPKYREMLFLS